MIDTAHEQSEIISLEYLEENDAVFTALTSGELLLVDIASQQVEEVSGCNTPGFHYVFPEMDRKSPMLLKQ